MPAIGYVTQDDNGSFKGELKTLSIKADITVVANDKRSNDTQRTTARCPAMSRSVPAGIAAPRARDATM